MQSPGYSMYGRGDVKKANQWKNAARNGDVHPDKLGSIYQKINPSNNAFMLKLDSHFSTKMWGWIVLKAEEKSKNNRRACVTQAFKAFTNEVSWGKSSIINPAFVPLCKLQGI